MLKITEKYFNEWIAKNRKYVSIRNESNLEKTHFYVLNIYLSTKVKYRKKSLDSIEYKSISDILWLSESMNTIKL